jgi:HD-GYP domain-containing protein (c-di-GMP phosphodiesterase class II)
MHGVKDSILNEYDYADDPLLKKGLHAWDRTYIKAMLSYDRIARFGRQLVAHQNRVSRDGAHFLLHLGYSQRAARNFRAAMLFHDIGKTHPHYNPMIWSLFDRPTPEQKAEQKKHTQRGAAMFESLSRMLPGLAEHPHFAVRHALTLYHHERMDGTGPEGVIASGLPRFVQAACIVDAYDGDRIQRSHQEKQRTPQEALRRMMGRDEFGRTDPKSKYAGAFSGTLLSLYVDMKEKERGEKISFSRTF